MLKLGSPVKGINATKEAVKLESVDTPTVDLIVTVDGAQSTCRKGVFEFHLPTVEYGNSAFRFFISASDIKNLDGNKTEEAVRRQYLGECQRQSEEKAPWMV